MLRTATRRTSIFPPGKAGPGQRRAISIRMRTDADDAPGRARYRYAPGHPRGDDAGLLRREVRFRPEQFPIAYLADRLSLTLPLYSRDDVRAAGRGRVGVVLSALGSGAVKAPLLEILRSPGTLKPLCLERAQNRDGETDTGFLRSPDGRSFEVRDAIPRFTEMEDSAQAQTRDAFGFKWGSRHLRLRGVAPAGRRSGARAIRLPVVDAWAARFEGLAACSMSAAAAGCHPAMADVAGVDGRRDVGRRRYLDGRGRGADPPRIDLPNTHFVQADALDLPFADGTFDAVFSEGVLHHTPSTRAALLSAARVLACGGEISFLRLPEERAGARVHRRLRPRGD